MNTANTVKNISPKVGWIAVATIIRRIPVQSGHSAAGTLKQGKVALSGAISFEEVDTIDAQVLAVFDDARWLASRW